MKIWFLLYIRAKLLFFLIAQNPLCFDDNSSHSEKFTLFTTKFFLQIWISEYFFFKNQLTIPIKFRWCNEELVFDKGESFLHDLITMSIWSPATSLLYQRHINYVSGSIKKNYVQRVHVSPGKRRINFLLYNKNETEFSH